MGMLISGTLRALISQHIISQTEAEAITEQAASLNSSIEDYLYFHTRMDSERIILACADYFNFPIVDKTPISFEIDKSTLIFKHQNHVALACYKPHELQNRSEPCFLISTQHFYQLKQQQNIHHQHDQHTAIEKLNEIFDYAFEQHASDIHIEPFQEKTHVRLRINGLLTHYGKISHTLAQQLTTRLKLLSNMDITQTRYPQDGGFSIQQPLYECDCRINFCPTLWGEKIVLRLLDTNHHVLKIEELGLTPHQLDICQQALHYRQGLILVTGPTGSGKTQTLYTMLNQLNQSSVNIATIEDPIEIKLQGINQIQVNNEIKLSFATVLRALLRQDPDIIMIGEIRDQETAELAIRAAHTGHLVLATLHTQSAVEAISRLQNLHIDRYNIAATLRLVISQRLIRCLKDQTLQQRSAIFECLPINSSLQNAIASGETIQYILKKAIHSGFTTLQQIGLARVNKHQTTLTELQRVIDIEEEIDVKI